jgi:hypothetical protein
MGKNTKTIEAKYHIGQVVWFYVMAGSTDDIFSYPCIGRGRITYIIPADRYMGYSREPEILYGMNGCLDGLPIPESNIYPDSIDEAIDRLNANWDCDWREYKGGC